MSQRLPVPGGRDVRATLDGGDASACVVACPPHPQHGGTRDNPLLRATSDALGEEDVACLRFDYGPWDGGPGERRDARNALRWVADGVDRVGLFGYSFGAGVALRVAADPPVDLAAASVLAPPASVAGMDGVDALSRVAAPLQVCYGARDDTVDWEPVVEAARERGDEVVEFDADHFFVGQTPKVGRAVGTFLAARLDG